MLHHFARDACQGYWMIIAYFVSRTFLWMGVKLAVFQAEGSLQELREIWKICFKQRAVSAGWTRSSNFLMLSRPGDLLFFRLVMRFKIPFSSLSIILDVSSSKLVLTSRSSVQNCWWKQVLNNLAHSWLIVVVLPLGNWSKVTECCSLLLLWRYL